MFGTVYGLYYFNKIGKSQFAPDCYASDLSNYPVKSDLTTDVVLDVSQRFNTLILMGFWGYALMISFTLLGILCGLANRSGQPSLFVP